MLPQNSNINKHFARIRMNGAGFATRRNTRPLPCQDKFFCIMFLPKSVFALISPFLRWL